MRNVSGWFFAASTLAFVGAVWGADNTPVWTDAGDGTLPASFGVQGEYVGEGDGVGKLGAQVIALDGEHLQAVIYFGGLPGAGWDGEKRALMAGKVEGGKAAFRPAEGSRKYLGNGVEEFSATQKFPPDGHVGFTGEIAGEVFSGKGADGKGFRLEKMVRVSETMGTRPPEGAVVLFDGKGTDALQGGRLDEKTGSLNTDGKDIRTKEKFSDYTMHLEFMLPFRPAARGQGRGNSGFYQVDHYEVQILDSFGLEGENNECAGVYKNAAPSVNMCLPPLTWQTYDAEFRNAVVRDGKVVEKARLTLRHNGVLVHDNIEINGPTGGHRNEPEGTPGPIKIQGHGNPNQFRNMWIVPKG